MTDVAEPRLEADFDRLTSKAEKNAWRTPRLTLAELRWYQQRDEYPCSLRWQVEQFVTELRRAGVPAAMPPEREPAVWLAWLIKQMERWEASDRNPANTMKESA